MISCDTNILLYAYNEAAPEHDSALEFIQAHLENPNFMISEFVLMEYYVLLRNPALVKNPLSAPDATKVVQTLRANPRWTVSKGTIDVSGRVWQKAAEPNFPRRAIFAARLAHSLAAEGVKMFATRNVADFQRFGLFDVFDPIV